MFDRRKRSCSKLVSIAICTILLVSGLIPLDSAAARATEYHGQVTYYGVPIPGVTVTATQGAKTVSTITDTQGLYQFPDLSDGAWKIHVEMYGFITRDGEATISASTPQGVWALQMQPMATILADATKVSMEAAPQLPPRPIETTIKKKPRDNPDTASKPPEEAADQGADGLLVNGSENNAATSNYSLSPAFGNQRSGVKALYNGSMGVIANNSIFNARPYSLTGQSQPKTGLSRVTTALSFGGPLRIPHILPHGPNFFLAYQWTRNRTEGSSPGLVPTVDQRNGILTQSTPILNPVTGQPYTGPIPVSPAATALLQLYPLPNLANDTRYNYERSVISNNHSDSFQSRLDKSTGHRDSFYGGYSFESQRENYTNLFDFVDTTNALGMIANVHWSHRLPHRVFANLGYTFSRQRTQVRPFFSNRQNVSGNAGIADATQTSGSGGNDQDAVNWGPPTLTFSSGITSLSDGNSSFNRNRTDAFSASATWVHRKHNVTFGGDFRRQEFNQNGQQNPRGRYSFSSSPDTTVTGSDLADFLIGRPGASTIAFGNADKYFRQSVSDLYVTDDWRLKPELTLDVGLRWDYGAPMTELKGRLVNLDVANGFTAANPVVGNSPKGPVTGNTYPASLVKPDHLGFQPRIGLSWRPFPASSIVVRAGYGIYDDTSVYLSAAEFMSQQAPLSTSVSVSNSPSCPLTITNGFRNCAGTSADTFAIDPDFRVGYAQTWQLAVQRELPAALVFSATYLGVKGTHGMQEFLPNTYAPGGTEIFAGRPRGFVYRTSGGNSTRQSGQLQLRRRLLSGLAASLQYTYSKSIDNDAQIGAQGHISSASATSSGTNSGGGSPMIAQNWLDLRAGERGASAFDQRHFLAATAQYTSGMGLHGGTLLIGWRGRLLKDWTLGTTISAGSGLPETPSIYEVVPGTGVAGTVRPDVNGTPIYRTSSTQTGRFLNAPAYSAPQPGQWGNAHRNSIVGPSLFSMDASLSRTFQMKGTKSFDVRADASNLLNHVNFTSWNTTLNQSASLSGNRAFTAVDNPTFGLPVSVKDMRSLQFTGRFRF
jgi:hypothetical protein